MIMQLATLRHIYDAEEPLATVYLQSQSVTADVEHEVRLRWDALRQQLADAGAHQQMLDSLDEAILNTEDFGTIQAEGRVLVADRTGLLLEKEFDASQEAGDRAVLGPVAQLGDYLRQRLRAVRALVVLVDKEQALLRREVFTSSDVLDSGAETHVEGSAYESVHKVREGFLHHRRMQQRADDAAVLNIRDVTESVRSAVARWTPDVIAVAGESQGRKLLLEELPTDLADMAREVEAGGGIPSGSADSGAEESLSEELATLARKITIDRASEQTERFGTAEGNGLAVQGAENVFRAVRLGAVDTLLLRYSQPAKDEDELLRAAASVDASVALVGTNVTDHAAAVLRYQAPIEELDYEPTSG